MNWKKRGDCSEKFLQFFTDFETVGGNKMQAKCTLCNADSGPKAFQKGNNSNLKKHLQRVSAWAL